MSLRKKLLDTFGAQVSSDHERYPADVKCLGFLYLYVGRYPRNNASRNSRDNLKNTLFKLFKIYVLGTKHPGFLEEREWRVFYTPELGRSKHIESEIVSIKGIPQEVHKIPLRDIPEIGFHGATIPDLLHRIIIGPSDQQVVMGKTFERLLTDAGCEDVDSKVHYSGIPLR